MRYQGTVYRPPSEANSYLLQATIGCSWNHCTYCAMYRDKRFRVRPVDETLEDVAVTGRELGDQVRKVFIMDGDALALGFDLWEPILEALRATFPNLRRVSCYATALNLLAKPSRELRRLRELGLKLLYIGPESGDDVTLKRIAKGATSAEHVEAAAKARLAGIKQSLIFLLGAGGTERSVEHATASAKLATAMDPEFLSALTLMLVPSTPIHRLAERGGFVLPDVKSLLGELRLFVAECHPTDTIFRCNHASNRQSREVLGLQKALGGSTVRDKKEFMMRQTDRQSLLFLILGTGFAMLFPVASTVSAVAGGPLQLPLVNGNTVFATNLYHELATAKGNLFFSPYSVSSALAMTYAGARGKTAEEMKAVLQFQLPQSQLHTAFRQLNEQLLANARGTGQTLRVANGLCLTGGDVNEEFKALLKDHYEAEFFSGGLDKINGWIKQKTDGKIEKVLEKLSKTSACVLLNAIYFKGTWANAFETSATREAPFSVSATKQVAVPLMFQESRFKILKKEEFRAAAIPYRGNRMSMIVLLPQDVSGLTQLEKQLTAQNLRQWLAELDQESAQKTQLFMPKFKLQAGYDLVPPCKDLGIKDAFEPARAEFRGMGSPRGGLCIAQIRHRALVEVNEEGSEAASATVVEMQLPGPPCPVFRADRPFLFLIRDNPTGTILFMGRVVDPTSL